MMTEKECSASAYLSNENTVLRALKAAFPFTIPIFAGFWFLALAYGILMNVNGFSFLYPMIMSAVIFGGSLEFIVVEMLMSPFAPLQAFIMALLVQARHIFYGITMLDRFKGLGWKKPFIVFGMCDETFSINYSAEIPEGVDRGWFMFFVTFLNWLYWVSGATVGGLVGSLINFNTEGLGFVMTAMFVAIFMDQFMKEKKPYTSLIGIGATAACLLIFGSDSFMIPAMLCIVALLTAFRRPIEAVYEADTKEGNSAADAGNTEVSGEAIDGCGEAAVGCSEAIYGSGNAAEGSVK